MLMQVSQTFSHNFSYLGKNYASIPLEHEHTVMLVITLDISTLAPTLRPDESSQQSYFNIKQKCRG